MVIKLKQDEAYVYHGAIKYLVAYDYSSGRSNRYTVLALNSDDPVTIGRELPLKSARGLIKDYEFFAAKMSEPFWGKRKQIQYLVKHVSEYRNKLCNRVKELK